MLQKAAAFMGVQARRRSTHQSSLDDTRKARRQSDSVAFDVMSLTPRTNSRLACALVSHQYYRVQIRFPFAASYGWPYWTS